MTNLFLCDSMASPTSELFALCLSFDERHGPIPERYPFRQVLVHGWSRSKTRPFNTVKRGRGRGHQSHKSCSRRVQQSMSLHPGFTDSRHILYSCSLKIHIYIPPAQASMRYQNPSSSPPFFLPSFCASACLRYISAIWLETSTDGNSGLIKRCT